MRFVSLFAGIGGLDLGLERAGMTCVAQVEKDLWCQQVLAKHWPDVPRWGDINNLDPKELPDHDLIAGGFPCQPVSAAGLRLAQDDPRWLWPSFFRIVRDVRPRFVVVENVPGLTVRGMGDVLGDLASIGYDTEWQSIPAAAVGAPHLRWRIFIVASPSGVPDTDRSPVWVIGQRGGQQCDVAGTTVAREDGSPRMVADTDEQRRARVNTSGFVEGLESARHESAGGSAARQGRAMADPEGITVGASRSPILRWRRPGNIGSASDPWATEPDVGRVANGVPARVDRLRGLGNAVVPQVAEVVGRMIMDAR